MHWNSATIGFLAVITVIGLVGPPLFVAQPTADAASVQSQPSDGACDYTELYNQTTESVVLVRQQGGQGSGFVYEAFDNGTSYVVTNQHVISGASRVDIKFRRGEVRTGTVVGATEAADLGVVRVNDTPDYASSLQVAESDPSPGRKVAALGSPFGLRGTITHGIISNTNRTVPTDRGFAIPDVIQTDAPINPGNSGGPLVTCNGVVVGVNTAGIPAGRAENIGFAISADLMEQVIPELIRTGKFQFPYLGVRTVDVTPAIAEANGLNATQGIMVVETVRNSPAEGVIQGANRTVTANGQQIPVGGDVLVAIEGQPIRSAEDLAGYLATETSPGDQVTLTVIRDGERRTVTVTLDARPQPPTA